MIAAGLSGGSPSATQNNPNPSIPTPIRSWASLTASNAAKPLVKSSPLPVVPQALPNTTGHTQTQHVLSKPNPSNNSNNSNTDTHNDDTHNNSNISNLISPLSSSLKNIKHIVLDSGALIAGLHESLYSLGSRGEDEGEGLAKGPAKFYTLDEVRNEIKDTRARHALQNFPFEIHTLNLTTQAIQQVQLFARATGDLTFLSNTDIKIAALAYSLERSINNNKFIRLKPLVGSLIRNQNHTNKNNNKNNNTNNNDSNNDKDEVNEEERTPWSKEIPTVASIPFDLNDFLFSPSDKFDEKYNTSLTKCEENDKAIKDSKTEENSSTDNNNDNKSDNNDGNKTSDDKSSKDIFGLGEDGEGEWITPSNLHNQIVSSKDLDSSSSSNLSSVCLITTDFALQNVCLSMGIRILSVSGLAITSLRQFVKRCHSCGTVTRNMNKEFCGSCGNATMIKISATLNSKGELKYSRRIRQQSKRGTVYSIPKPKGGRGNKDLILTEDSMPGFTSEATNSRFGGARKKDQLDDGWQDAALFAAQIKKAENKHTVGYGRNNPNVVHKTTGHRKRNRR